ncbi:MAG TPA: cytochrome C oxidase subunit IV family protein [Sulfurimonas sp.]|uniref:cytochrome C oxidase subunit IV family protein n=1 Tax=Sulfurimonas sp. TaxID=2022749 RepID=UPI002BB57215|nr:cytochrome C oxidase subunit IV family protein [Sulfurimonas sp.]HUH43432.1 cytochrome C oxidase subunit IV family protein [Sulfurimonas sp.]
MKKRAELIWIVLVVFTIFAYFLGQFDFVNTLMVGILLMTTFIKGELITDYFMSLKNVKLKYRMIPTIWLAAVMSSIAVAYYLPTQ